MDWVKKAIENLIPLSKEQVSLENALTEWYATEHVIDYQTPSETCELCGKTGLRYHYEISNTETAQKIWVGSKCILRFEGIAVYGQNRELLQGKDREKRLRDFILEHEKDAVLKCLRSLYSVVFESYREHIEKYVDDFKERNAFRPYQLLSLFKQMQKFRGAGQAIGKNELAPHDLRRTYAQLGYEAGIPITQISKLLGHASVATTQRYLNLDLDLNTTISDFIPV